MSTCATTVPGRTKGKLTMEPLGGLSFCKLYRDSSGMIVRSTHFDVPKETFEDGYLTGLAAAGELLAALRESARQSIPHHVTSMLQAAAEAAARQPRGGKAASRAGAARGFLDAMAEMIRFAGKHSNHEAWIAERISRRREDAQRIREIERNERETFPARMKAAREAKRAAAVA